MFTLQSHWEKAYKLAKHAKIKESRIFFMLYGLKLMPWEPAFGYK